MGFIKGLKIESELVIKYSFLMGLSLLAFVFLQVCVTALAFYSSISFTHSNFYIATFSWVSLYLVFTRRYVSDWYFNLLLLSTLILILICSAAMAGIFYDISWDGQAYHQQAIIKIAEGWNPYGSNLRPEELHSKWINHYPKASWLYAANLFKLTGQIEYGKSFNILLALASFFLTFSALIELRRNFLIQNALIGLLVAANPIVLQQVFTFYIDGAIGSLIACLLVSYLLLYHKKEMGVILCVMSGVLLVNLKFTALVYYSVLSIGFGFGLVIFFRNSIKLPSYIFAVASALLIGVVGIGYNPYVKNLIEKGHIFYPLMGQGHVDFMPLNTPYPLRSKGTGEKFLLSLFSETSNDINQTESLLKIPFSIKSYSEVIVSAWTDVRLAGMGVFFSGIFIISAIGLLWLAVVAKKSESKMAVTLVMASLIISIFLNPESWWARYVPQVWALVMLVFIFCLVSESVYCKRIGYLGLLAGSLNCMIILLQVVIYNTRSTNSINSQLDVFSNHEGSLSVFYGPFESNKLRLQNRNISAKQVKKLEELPCLGELVSRGASSEAYYCMQ